MFVMHLIKKKLLFNDCMFGRSHSLLAYLPQVKAGIIVLKLTSENEFSGS